MPWARMRTWWYFDPDQKFTITQPKLHQNVDYTPYEGMEMTGMPYAVYSRGKRVAEWKDDHVEFVGEVGRGALCEEGAVRRFLKKTHPCNHKGTQEHKEKQRLWCLRMNIEKEIPPPVTGGGISF